MKQKYRFIFRYDGELGQTLHECRPGDADRIAAQLARVIGRRYKAADVVCIWRGPASDAVPRKLIAEVSA